jgi:hypothetical protein
VGRTVEQVLAVVEDHEHLGVRQGVSEQLQGGHAGRLTHAARDPYVNAWAGVKHLSTLEKGRLHGRKLLKGRARSVQCTEYLYRLLYTYHFHGSRSLYEALGSSLMAQAGSQRREFPISSATTPS